MLQRVQKTVGTPPIQFNDTAVDVPVMAQRQVHLVQRVQNTVEMPVAQFSDRVVDIPVVTQRQVPNVQKTGGTLKRLCMHPLWRHTNPYLAEEERIVDWTQDLREIRRMVEFLVRWKRKLDAKWRSGGLRGWRRSTPSWKTKNAKPASQTPSQTGPKSRSSLLTVVRRQRLRLWNSPHRRSHLHPRQRCPRCRSPHDRH